MLNFFYIIIVLSLLLLLLRWNNRNKENYDIFESEFLENVSEEELPSKINLTAKIGNGYVQLHWMPPENGYKTLKNYVIVFKNKSIGRTKIITHEKTNCQTCTKKINIEKGIKYSIYVLAINQDGTGPKSNIVNIFSQIEKKKVIPNKQIMVTCLPDGNFKENSYCRKTEKILPKINLLQHESLIDRLNQNVKKYNFDLL